MRRKLALLLCVLFIAGAYGAVYLLNRSVPQDAGRSIADRTNAVIEAVSYSD